ncbi:uncharacterized protein TNCV_2318481 [Trichonephila clavipes]|nr:uncharacterized protein TNCV_2318481 [Trichonephila clavipes]
MDADICGEDKNPILLNKLKVTSWTYFGIDSTRLVRILLTSTSLNPILIAEAKSDLRGHCRLPKWEAKTRHGESFVLALLNTLEEDLKQQPVYQDSSKDTLLDLSLVIELVIPFSPNQDPQDIPQQLYLSEVVHYHPSE